MGASLPSRAAAVTIGVLTAAAVAAPASASAQASQGGTERLPVTGIGPLRDLQPDVTNPTDGAAAALVAVSGGDALTRFRLAVWNMDRSSAGDTFGTHVHVGPCVAGNGEAAGSHYNTGGPPSPDTEVWLDFTVTASGAATSSATTPFLIPPGGAQSVVIHADPTSETGEAGERLACLPVRF